MSDDARDTLRKMVVEAAREAIASAVNLNGYSTHRGIPLDKIGALTFALEQLDALEKNPHDGPFR